MVRVDVKGCQTVSEGSSRQPAAWAYNASGLYGLLSQLVGV
jgi:hypothetical protein